MAERRSTRTKRRPSKDEPAQDTGDELAEEPEDELAEEPEDELAEDELDEEPEDEEPEDELDEVPEDELDEEPEDEEPEDEEPDEEDSRQRSRNRGRGTGTKRRPRGGRSGGLSAAKAGQAALRQIGELIGKEPEGITGVEPGEDGWVVGVEVVEDRRIPSSTDILATYEVEIDSDGELMSYRRVRRYPRGRGDDEDS